ncbi:MAG: hypothetical protein ABW061_22385 [Polyangiaceae bacterium]
MAKSDSAMRQAQHMKPRGRRWRVVAASVSALLGVCLVVFGPSARAEGPASPAALDPAWPKVLTVITDSVALVVGNPLRITLPGWRISVLGRPALMVNQALPEFLKHKYVGPVVVVGLGYNSQFEKNHKNEARWNGLWDYRAEQLLRSLKERGAKKVVWLTLREPTPSVVTSRGQSQYEQYAWFFPLVNARIHALAARHPEVAVADWARVSNVPGVTTDLIHLNRPGAKLMAEVIAQAVLGPPPLASPVQAALSAESSHGS